MTVSDMHDSRKKTSAAIIRKYKERKSTQVSFQADSEIPLLTIESSQERFSEHYRRMPDLQCVTLTLLPSSLVLTLLPSSLILLRFLSPLPPQRSLPLPSFHAYPYPYPIQHRVTRYDVPGVRGEGHAVNTGLA